MPTTDQQLPVTSSSSSRASRRKEFLGCPVDLITTDELLGELRGAILDRAAHQPPRVIQFLNANKIAQVHSDPVMREVMGRAAYVLTDGQPMLPMARLLGLEIPERIDGIGLMQRLLAFAETNGFRVFLLGAKTDVLEACVAKIRAQYPALRIAGFRNGYFSADEAEDVAREVAVTQADIVFLGMGSPMKEFFADRHAATMGVPVVQGVGGSFDVIAGQVPRAPVWLQRLGLEWLFRVVQEPRRMFWRYAKTNSQCLVLFVRAWLGRSKSGI